jgi:hypothetical protein
MEDLETEFHVSSLLVYQNKHILNKGKIIRAVVDFFVFLLVAVAFL